MKNIFLILACTQFLRSHLPAFFVHDFSVMALGDSITAGSVLENGALVTTGGYREPLWKYFHERGRDLQFLGDEIDGAFQEPFHEGHVGIRSDELLKRVPDIFSRWQPKIVLLMIGTNDINQGHTVDETVQNILQLVRKIHAVDPGARILLAGPIPSLSPKMNELFGDLNTKLSETLKAPGLDFVTDLDMYHGLRLEPVDFSDPIHPNATGYGKIAAIWATQLEKILP